MTFHGLCSKCIIGKIEGKGISTSQCPTCNQPGWKRDLKPVHVLANIAEPISHLLDAGRLYYIWGVELYGGCEVEERLRFSHNLFGMGICAQYGCCAGQSCRAWGGHTEGRFGGRQTCIQHVCLHAHLWIATDAHGVIMTVSATQVLREIERLPLHP